jgi:hypothetical protein
LAGEEIRLGSYWRKTLLGTSSVYRIVALSGDVVTVEVCSAPGLKPGTQLRFVPEAFSAMEEMDEPQS